LGPDPAARENFLVLIDDLFADQPDKSVVFDPISQELGAGH
jgi:hypothetical protein